MKNIKSLIVFLVLFLSPTLAFAGQCPMLIAQVNEKLATSNLAEDKKIEVETLRDEAESLHKSGDHQTSEQLLQEALELLKS
jgi:hypothetical protein